MPRSLAPIPLGTPITERDGTISAFFRQRWQDVGNGWTQTPSLAQASRKAQTAALGTTTLLTVVTPGLYRVSWYLRITRPDPVSSSVTVGVNFLDVDGQALSYSGAAVTGNTVNLWQGVVVPIRCGAPTDITISVAYASTTPGALRYDLEACVEFLP
jgi:hypothetical protein